MYLKDFQNKNKIALVTGAGKGIGKAAALALAESGADIIAISRTASDLAQLQKKINRLNKRCMTFQCDILDYDQIKKVFSKISKIDILLNNAGTNIPEHFTKKCPLNFVRVIEAPCISSSASSMITGSSLVIEVQNNH